MATCNDFEKERDDGGVEYRQKWLTIHLDNSVYTFMIQLAQWTSQFVPWTQAHPKECHILKNITVDVKYIDLDKITWLTEWCNSTCWRATAITKSSWFRNVSSECSFCFTYSCFCTSESSAWHTKDTPWIFAQWMKCVTLKLKALSSPGQHRK